MDTVFRPQLTPGYLPPDATRFGRLTKRQKERAYYGGTFDPPHNGHIAMIDAARKLGIKSFTIMPAGDPIHKQDRKVSPFADRVEMTRRAFANQPDCDISTIEGTLAPPTPTIEAMRALFPDFDRQRQKVPFILGADSIASIATWEEAKTLLRQLVFLVMPRDGYEVPETVTIDGETIPIRKEMLPGASSGISSTQLREVLQQGESETEAGRSDILSTLKAWLPLPVAEYIVEKGLYRKDREGSPKETKSAA